MRKIRVIVKKPGTPSSIEIIENDLKSFQKLVGGYIQVVRVSDHIWVICDEEGTLKQLPYNASFQVTVKEVVTPVDPQFVINLTGREIPKPGETGYYDIVGTFVLVRSNGDEFVSLTDEDLKLVNEAMPKGP